MSVNNIIFKYKFYHPTIPSNLWIKYYNSMIPKTGSSLGGTKVIHEINSLETALKDMKEDVLIEVPTKKTSEKISNYSSITNKIVSMRSEEFNNLCKFDTFRTDKYELLSESSLKFSLDTDINFNDPVSSNLKSLSSSRPKKPPESQMDSLKENYLKLKTELEVGKNEEINKPNNEFTLLTGLRSSNNEDPISDSFANSIKQDKPYISVPSQKELLKEIENLRKENNMLRLKLNSSKKSTKKPKTKAYDTELTENTPKTPTRNRSKNNEIQKKSTRSVSRSKSFTPRGFSSKSPSTPLRSKHCNVCDHLLSKGYSTKYCSKHGKNPPK
jgi:hypothetical protein